MQVRSERTSVQAGRGSWLTVLVVRVVEVDESAGVTKVFVRVERLQAGRQAGRQARQARQVRHHR